MASFGNITTAAERSNGLTVSHNNNGNGPLVVLVQAFDSGPVAPTVTQNGVAMTARYNFSTSLTDSWFTLDSPATGAQNVIVAGFANKRHRVKVFATNDAAFKSASGTVGATAASATTGAITTAVGDLVLAGLTLAAAADPTVVATGDAVELSEGVIVTGQAAGWGWDATFTADDTSATMSATWTGSVANHISYLVLENAAAPSAPTIDTQPTAGTCVLNNDTRTSKTFTVAATTSGGALSYQWQDEDSVGAGTYSNISNGGIHAGATTASLVVTPTTKTGLTGIRYRCNVTDDNGTTTTDAVALTVYNGVILSAASATTNGSGVATITYTTDLPVTTNGAFNKFAATCDGATSHTSGRPAA